LRYIFAPSYDQVIVNVPYTGKTTRAGPDGVETITRRDAANRVKSVVRRLPDTGVELLSAYYFYYGDGSLREVEQTKIQSMGRARLARSPTLVL